jgi:hypothetical protein
MEFEIGIVVTSPTSADVFSGTCKLGFGGNAADSLVDNRIREAIVVLANQTDFRPFIQILRDTVTNSTQLSE